MRVTFSALVVTTWSGAAFAQGGPASPPAAPPPAPMTVPGPTTPAPSPPVAPPAPPTGATDGRYVLAPAPSPPAPVAAAPYLPFPSRRDDPYVRRPLVLEGHTSFGGPSGWLGIGVDYSVARYFSLMAGAGLGQSGPQLSTMARLRLPMDTVSAGFGAGFSGGEYEDRFLGTGDRYRWDTAYWLNTEGFIEIRTRKGLNIRPYLGSGTILNRSAGKAVAPDCIGPSLAQCVPVAFSRAPNPFLFYMGAAIGYAFEL